MVEESVKVLQAQKRRSEAPEFILQSMILKPILLSSKLSKRFRFTSRNNKGLYGPFSTLIWIKFKKFHDFLLQILISDCESIGWTPWNARSMHEDEKCEAHPISSLAIEENKYDYLNQEDV